MINLKCYYTQLVTLYSKRILYGIKCDLKELYADLTNARRFIRIKEAESTCQLSGMVIDEYNKFINKINKKYTLTCPNC